MLSLALALFDVPLSGLPALAQVVGTGFVWMILETIFLAAVGSTPGKILYGLTLDAGGAPRLGFNDALRRSVMVFVAGMGLCLPLLNHIMLLVNFWRLSKRGTTEWDEASNCVERRRQISIPGLMAALFVTFGLFYLVIDGYVIGVQSPGLEGGRTAWHAA